MKREPAEPQGFIKLTGVGIPRLQAGEDVKRMMPDDHDGPMGVPLNFLERWAPGNGFMLLGKLDDPTVNGRRLYKRLLVRRTRDA